MDRFGKTKTVDIFPPKLQTVNQTLLRDALNFLAKDAFALLMQL